MFSLDFIDSPSEQSKSTLARATSLTLTACAFTVVAWWAPGGLTGAFFGWAAAFLFVASLNTRPSYRAFYLSGVLVYVLGFYWLAGTISSFGGFSLIATLLLFLLYAFLSALQFPLIIFLFKRLPPVVDTAGMRTALAWTTVEFAMPRIFPWQMGHTQIGFTPFVQIADIGGSLTVSFLLFWVCEAAWKFFFVKERRARLAAALLIFPLVLTYGIVRMSQFSNPSGPEQEVALIQGNITPDMKGDPERVAQNTAAYAELTEAVQKDDLLVIWPETAIQDWIPAALGRVEHDPRIPRFEKRINLLTGALTFESRKKFFNSALAIYSDGAVPPPSNKQILMPYGEYTPLANIFPWMRDINSTVADFSAGDDVQVFSFPRGAGKDERTLVSTLICYEDMVPSLAREAVRKGAQLLVNLTNDAWFGRSPAPRDHNMMASFRAIENRRFLLRVTNTGLTAVINPLGQTVTELPIFERGTLLSSGKLLSYKTLYTQFIGEGLWWVVAILCLGAISLRGIEEYVKNKPSL